MPEDHAPAFFLHVEQAHGLADAAVVALLGLLDAQQIGVQVFLGGPGRRIDALKLRIAVVSAPVGPRQLGQFEGLADEFGRGEMRPPAQVDPVAGAIGGDRLRARQVADQLGLEGLALAFEQGDGGLALPDLPDQLFIAVDNLGHLLLDGGEVVGRERFLAVEVVIEAVIDRRADGHLGTGEQLLHGLGEDVGRVVADGLEGFGIIAHDQFEVARAAQRPVEIALFAVQGDQGRALGQRGGDGGGHVTAGGVVGILARGAVGEFEVDHVFVFAGGTGSYFQPSPKGWHLQRRLAVSHPPLSGPCWISASRP